MEPAHGAAHRAGAGGVQPYWYEDPLRADNLDALATFAAAPHVPVTLSETIATRWAFREAFERGAAGIAMLDVSWCGGISEAKKIATMAEAHQLPVAPHDCTGPIVLVASTPSLDQRAERADPGDGARLLQRLVPGAGDDASGHSRGQVQASTLPGLGLELLPHVPERADAIRRVTKV